MKDISMFLLWCLALNYLILIIWFIVFVFAHDFIYRLHSRWFSVNVEKYDMVHLVGMSVYKLGIMLFNLVPVAALYMTNR